MRDLEHENAVLLSNRKNLWGTVEEYRLMPCSSLRERMFGASERAGVQVKQIEDIIAQEPKKKG